jgi:CMP-N-acetylneuraminic acid synthetase
MTIDKPLCIIPARGGSKRFPRKNIALLSGKPLLVYAIEFALKSKVFDTVVVSSEDEEILEIASEFGAKASRRPEELAGDKVQVKTVCRYVLNKYSEKGKHFPEFAVLITTNPLRTAQDIVNAYDLFKNSNGNYLLSLVPLSHPPQRAVRIKDGFVEPFWVLNS